MSMSLSASPWLNADGALKADLQRLASAGLIRTPLMTWPVSVASLKADLARYSTEQIASDYLPAFNRVRRRLELETQPGLSSSSQVEWANEHRSGQGIVSLPNQTRLAAGPSYLNDWLAAGLKVNRILEPTSERDTRFDDSYLAAVLGNWMLGAGEIRRFWGPQWASSLAMDSLQAPAQSLWLGRNQAVDNGFGPWSFKGLVGRDESINDNRIEFRALRFDWRPMTSVEWSADLIDRAHWVAAEPPSVGLADSEMESRQWGTDLRWQLPAGQTLYGQWQQFRWAQQQQSPFALGWSWGPNADSRWLWYLEFQRQPPIGLADGVSQPKWLNVKNSDADTERQLAIGSQIRGAEQGDWHWQIRHQNLSESEANSKLSEWSLKLNHGTPCFGFSCRFHLGWQSNTNQPWSVGLVWDSRLH